MAGRHQFTMKEDKIMLLYLIKELQNGNTDAKNPKGYEIWKKAEKEKVTGHSWQSMNSRFRKKVLPDIDIQPITEQQKKFLRSRLGLPTPSKGKFPTRFSKKKLCTHT